jgi:hypothetical protein
MLVLEIIGIREAEMQKWEYCLMRQHREPECWVIFFNSDDKKSFNPLLEQP